MPCSPRDLLVLAKELHAKNINETVARASLSRAYYAALHEVQNTFPQRSSEYRVDGESTHAEVIARAATYGKQVVPGRGSAAAIAKAMTRLRRARNFADYRLERDFSVVHLDDEVLRAEEIFALCADVLSKIKTLCDKPAAVIPTVQIESEVRSDPSSLSTQKISLKRIL